MLPSNIMTQEQEMSLFEILSIPYTTVGYTLTDDLGTVRSAAAITPSATILPEIEAFFTGGTIHGITYPPMDAGVLARILYYINEWIAIDIYNTRVVAGGIGEGAISQVTDDPREARQNIREFVRNAVPFLTRYAYLLKQQGDAMSSQGAGGSSMSHVEVIH